MKLELLTKNTEQSIDLSPEFDLIDPSTITGHIQELKVKRKSLDRSIEINPSSIGFGIFKFKIVKPKDENESKYSIFDGFYRTGLLTYLSDHFGFYRLTTSHNTYMLVKEENGIIEEVSSCTIRNKILEYITELGGINFEFNGLLFSETQETLTESFHNHHHYLIAGNQMDLIKDIKKPFLRDDIETSYFFFKNGIVKVKRGEKKELIPFGEFKGFIIWKSWIRDHEIDLENNNDAGHFSEFIKNVSGTSLKEESFISALGYLLHNINIPSKNQAVICYDEKITNIKKPMGGTGKGLYSNAIGKIRDICTIDGKRFKEDDKFNLQKVSPSTQLVFIDETSPKFDFTFLNSVLSDGLTIEKKNQDAFRFDKSSSPKFIIASNGIMASEGTTIKRRQHILEFTDFYSSKIIHGNEEPIRDYHNGLFFDDWDPQEWNRFYCFMLNANQLYFEKGLVESPAKNILKNRLIQITSEEFYEWTESQCFEEKEYETETLFYDFKNTYLGSDSTFKQRSFNNWMKDFASSKGLELKVNRSNSVSKFRLFKPKTTN